MPKRALIVIRLLPETKKVLNESLRSEIEKEMSRAIFVIPWADKLEFIEIKP
jgi:hypothetical protein